MTRLSNNITLLLKVFIPICYIVFFGSFLIGSFLVSTNDAPFVSSLIFKLVFGSVFLVFILLMYFTVFKLMRVDADSDYFYVNNYRNTYRYPWDEILKIRTRNYGLFKTIVVTFKAKASVGKRVVFLPATALVTSFMAENPSVFALMDDE